MSDMARCLVLDLLGHGESHGPEHLGPGSYTFVEHDRHLDPEDSPDLIGAAGAAWLRDCRAT